MQRLVPVESPDDVFPEYRDTPIGRLLAYHDLGAPLERYDRAELLVGMCMDHRKSLRLPDNFAYVIRTGGANLRNREFEVSFAVAVGGVRAIALIGHSDCRMAGVASRKEEFVAGLVENAGWDPEEAHEHFGRSAPKFEIADAVDFTLTQVERLRRRYPKVLVAPLHYRVEDRRLYLIRE